MFFLPPSNMQFCRGERRGGLTRLTLDDWRVRCKENQPVKNKRNRSLCSNQSGSDQSASCEVLEAAMGCDLGKRTFYLETKMLPVKGICTSALALCDFCRVLYQTSMFPYV